MGIEDLRWADLVRRVRTRRDFLRIGARSAALIACGGTLAARRGDAGPRFRSEPFGLGVASGDPLPDGLVLWTRLSGPALEETGAGDARVPVRWEVAEDEAFTRVVRSGEALAIPELGHSVHVEVDGLRPGYVYHYRFVSGGAVSRVGRSRTAPAVGAPTERMRFAFCSCQNWEDGWYTAYRHMAGEDLDLVVHLGDYIYEIGQSPRAIRPHEGPELFSLDQYRSRYALYRTDPDLQAVHAAFAWAVTWDDHDVDNNYAGGIPERGDPIEFLERRTAAYQAYYEFLPLRRRSAPSAPGMSIYRSLQFGDLMAMHVLDTRQYRDDQPCGDRFKPDCDERFDPARSLLGDAQEAWLIGRLRESRAKWSVLAQQVMMAPLKNWNTDGDATHSMDTWDGYPIARQRVLDTFASGVRNPVVLTGDVHSSWVADLHAGDPDSPVVGTELVCSSITTNMDGSDVPLTDGFRQWNPHLRYHEERRGYVSCELTPERLAARFRFVPWVTRPDAPLQTRATFAVEDGRPGAVRV